MSVHFDAEGLVRSVHEQDIGLRVTTNHPDRFKQLLYKAARETGLKVHIYTYPQRPNSLALMKEAPKAA